MTNQMIILNESVRLMNEGILKGTGEFVTMEFADGQKREIELPEEIHTFNGWKDRGFKVKKGAHAKAKFSIWKCRTKKVETEEGEEEDKAMFMKLSAFFTRDQVEELTI